MNALNIMERVLSSNFNSLSTNSICYCLSTQIGNHEVSMDVLQVLDTGGKTPILIGAFHISEGIAPNEGDHSQLYLATASPDATTEWSVVKSNTAEAIVFSDAGSMGFLYQEEHSEAIYLSYELESGSGNTIAIRKYETPDRLFKNESAFEYRLKKEVFLAGDHNGFSDVRTAVRNIGTPSIERIEENVIHLKFHYAPNDDEGNDRDVPGRGHVFITQGTSGVLEDYDQWAGYFHNDVNNAIRVAGVPGKIGGRDSFLFNDLRWYVYEAQEIHNEWDSWRIFLYCPELNTQEVVKVGFSREAEGNGALISFANPHVTKLSDQKIVLTLFVHSDAIPSNPPLGMVSGPMIATFDLTSMAQQCALSSRKKRPSTASVV